HPKDGEIVCYRCVLADGREEFASEIRGVFSSILELTPWTLRILGNRHAILSLLNHLSAIRGKERIEICMEITAKDKEQPEPTGVNGDQWNHDDICALADVVKEGFP